MLRSASTSVPRRPKRSRSRSWPRSYASVAAAPAMCSRLASSSAASLPADSKGKRTELRRALACTQSFGGARPASLPAIAPALTALIDPLKGRVDRHLGSAVYHRLMVDPAKGLEAKTTFGIDLLPVAAKLGRCLRFVPRNWASTIA